MCLLQKTLCIRRGDDNRHALLTFADGKFSVVLESSATDSNVNKYDIAITSTDGAKVTSVTGSDITLAEGDNTVEAAYSGTPEQAQSFNVTVTLYKLDGTTKTNVITVTDTLRLA